MPIKAAALALALVLSAFFVQDVSAQPAAQSRTPLQLAEAVERRAGTTDFKALEAFGREAIRRNDREGLQRLYHVTWIFLNQGEFDTARIWNDRLMEGARHQGSRRYIQIARLNALALRYDQGETAAADEMHRLASMEPDWFARTHATRLWALALMDRDQIGEGLKLLTDADALIPEGDAYARIAQAGLWEMTGIGLMRLNDIDGATAAFGRFEIDFANPDYPRPDFDAVYNLARLSTQLGDVEQAKRLYQVHHRLTLRAGLPSLAVYDARLCAMVAQAAEAPRDVLRCLAPYGENLGDASFLARQLLPARAIARAQTGQIEAARRDLTQIRRRITVDRYREEARLEVAHAEAEILFAEGRAAEAYAKLRAYNNAERVAEARVFSGGIRQVTGDMQHKLTERRAQLETARSNTRLQGLILTIAAIFILSALAALLWMGSQARDLRIARRRAEEASRSKSEFLANMSHEIRTPLNGVVAMADSLSRAGLEPREREMVEVIRSSAVTLERLLSDILDTSKIEAGQIVLERSVFDLGDTVRGAAALYRPRADEKGVALRVEVEPTIEGAVEGDVVRVRQVLSNLISNALKFTETGSVVVAAVAVGEDRARFTVSDTGCGFDAEQKGRIFNRFQQADGSITRRFGGTGLGLAISRDLVELMGGLLDCDGRPGAGADFWFEIPLTRTGSVQSPSAPAGPGEGDKDETDARAFPARILLADDHPANRKVVEILLTDMPTELVVVEDGRQAVEAFRKGGFDLVLMDMQMPVMDGLTATAAIRALEAGENRARAPIIMLTANALPDHVEAGRVAGADGHLSKPITLVGLLDGVAAALAAAERRENPVAA
ncbi:ATP-binding protein [Brevundimonas mediterranea]|uniref:histidine kinase n=1 Tax=Brevundimonas mediterranea TaxID=74329 RepID=A0A7W6A5K6_9CAUL|nr:ATP-binding protein [Brevundimonas mediterranea]MBB3872120.1 signal transduction histidine kinase/ActR/RegA family two-component response regulator [Brevundimonas mediterranea]